MFTSTISGIALDSFATIDSDCGMVAEIRGPEIQLEIGPPNSLLNVVTDLDALRKLSTLISDTVARYDNTDDHEPFDARLRVDYNRDTATYRTADITPNTKPDANQQ